MTTTSHLIAGLLVITFLVSVLCIQQFRIRPANKSVIQGQTTILPCEVEGREGRVQWTKDGFALGFDRDIPGYSRYRMLGDESAGEFGLMISNVRLDDDAEFQCQVGPASGHPAIFAAAYLTVQVPPEAPTIDRHPNGSTVEVPHTQALVLLTCQAKNGRPAATISWRKDGEEITEGIAYTKSNAGNKKENAKSVLTIRPEFHPERNAAMYQCLAQNDALPTPLVTTVQLSIQYPPSKPEISGYRNGKKIRAGDTLKLMCVSKGGNPLAQVVWFKNNEEVDFSYTSGSKRAVNELVFTVQASDNDAIYRCEASNVVTPKPLTAAFKLTVHFGPTKVEISGKKLAKAGEEVKLSCVTTKSNPAAVFIWYAKGKQLQLPKSATRVEPSPDGGYITHSDVTVRLTNEENNVIYSCQATNTILGLTVTDRVTLSVLSATGPTVTTTLSPITAAWSSSGHESPSVTNITVTTAVILVDVRDQPGHAQSVSYNIRCEDTNPEGTAINIDLEKKDPSWGQGLVRLTLVGLLGEQLYRCVASSQTAVGPGWRDQFAFITAGPKPRWRQFHWQHGLLPPAAVLGVITVIPLQDALL